MKLRLIVLFIALCFIGQLNVAAQDGKKTQDVVYLKNGSIIRGEIVEIIVNESVAIQTYDYSIWVFSADEIEKITQEAKLRGTFVNREKGYYNVSEVFGVLFASGNPPTVGMRTINGYKFNDRVQLGLGIGVDWNFDWDISDWGVVRTIPIVVDFRGDIVPNSRFTPIYFANMGYGIGTQVTNEETVKGGANLGLGMGFKLRGNKGWAWIFSLGFQMQDVEITRVNLWDGTSRTRTGSYRRFGFRTGFTF